MNRVPGSTPSRRPVGPRQRKGGFPLGRLLLGLLLVGLVVGAAEAFTPLHDLTNLVLGRSVLNYLGGNAPAPRGSPTPAHPAQQIGADASSVTDTSPGSAQAAAAIPTASLGDTRFAFLLLGYGGNGHDGAYLTDSMMVVIADPAHQTLTLLSVPRDSWVPLYFNGKTAVYNKINTAYAFAQDSSLYPDRRARYTGLHGPGNFAMDTVSRLLGISIQYYAGLDFQGFRDMINAIGGVQVNVPDGFAARYPINDNPSINAGWTVVRFTPGLQHMNGERAIEYARAREAIQNLSEGTDFARSRRQRLIMEAFKARLLQPGGLIHLPQLLSIASQHVDTNYTIPDVTKLTQLILGWKNVHIYQTALTTSNYLEDGTGPDGTYVTVPASPDHSWAQIRAFAHHLWANPAAGVAMASTTIVVENDSSVNGLAGRVTDALATMGYQVGTPISGSLRARTRLADETGGAATTPFIHQLQTDLGLPNLPISTAATANTSNPRVVLQLGQDEANLSPTVTVDRQAPFSTVGVVKFGVWPYVPAPPTPIPEPRPRVAPAAPTDVLPTPTTERVISEPAITPPTPTPAPLDASVIVVPQLVGMSEAAAQHLILADGLMTTYVNYQTLNQVADRQYFLSIPPDHVLSQSPAPGEKVPRGTRVLLAVRHP